MRGTCRTGLAGRSIPVGTSKVIVAPAPESWWVTALTPELCPGPHSWGCHVAGWRRLRGQGRAGLGVGTWTGEAGGGDRAGPAPALGGEQGHAARVPCTCVPPGEQVAPYRQAHSRLKTAARLRPTPSSEGGQPPRLLNVGLEGLGLVQTWDGPEPLQDASLGGLPEQPPTPSLSQGQRPENPPTRGIERSWVSGQLGPGTGMQRLKGLPPGASLGAHVTLSPPPRESAEKVRRPAAGIGALGLNSNLFRLTQSGRLVSAFPPASWARGGPCRRWAWGPPHPPSSVLGAWGRGLGHFTLCPGFPLGVGAVSSGLGSDPSLAQPETAWAPGTQRRCI